MEKIIQDFSLSLFLWQFFMICLLIVLIYFLRKVYIKFMKK